MSILSSLKAGETEVQGLLGCTVTLRPCLKQTIKQTELQTKSQANQQKQQTQSQPGASQLKTSQTFNPSVRRIENCRERAGDIA